MRVANPKVGIMETTEIMLYDYSVKVMTELFMACIGRNPNGNELMAMLGKIDYHKYFDWAEDYEDYLLSIAQNVAESAKDF